MADETRQLARFAAELSYDHIPERIRARAVDLIVDQIGVQIGCSTLPWGLQVREAYRRSGGKPEATVVRYGDRLPVESAAFINSTFGHSFEYDDANPLSPGHPGAEFVPPLLAVAERDHRSGRDFLTSFIAAYELRGHIGWSVAPDLLERGGPHYPTTCGPFGAAGGVAKLLQLDTEGIRNALAIAGGYSGGLMQYDQSGGSSKRIICAIGGCNGMQAAHLAQAGMTGPEGILEGERGLLKIFSNAYRPERLVADLGVKWMIDHALLKPYSCCAIITPAIDGLKNLIAAHRLRPDHIAAIEVGYPKRSVHHVAISAPHDLLGMQFSTSYSLALTALRGSNSPRDYTMQALADPGIRDFASRVEVREDDELTRISDGKLPARVRLRTSAGQWHEELVINGKGFPGAPLSSADVDTKFRSQVADALGDQCCEQLLATLRAIGALDDIARLAPLLAANN